MVWFNDFSKKNKKLEYYIANTEIDLTQKERS
jgi:hypothetical protein